MTVRYRLAPVLVIGLCASFSRDAQQTLAAAQRQKSAAVQQNLVAQQQNPTRQPPPVKRQQKPANARPPRQGRSMQVIDGAWQFLPDPQHIGETSGWERAAPKAAKTITIPALWSAEAAPGYAGVAWYWRRFEIPEPWKEQTIRLRFEAIAEQAQVWLNGQRLGAHTGGATPFEFNVTRAIHFGTEANWVAVRLEGDAKNGAGLWQGVLLLAHDEAYLDDCFPQADGLGHLTAAITLVNTSKNTGDATLDARIVAANAPTRDVKKTLQNLHLTPDRNQTTLLASVSGKSLQLWTPAHPFLYALQLAFRQDKDVLDTYQILFGFREFGFHDGALTLNGETLQPSAIAPQLTLPVVIATTDDTARARELLHRLHDKGVNIVYLDAPPPALLHLADEEGLLVVEAARPRQAPQAAAEELRALIVRDRAHPCILAWNVRDADSGLTRTARQLDPTRFLLAGSGANARLWLPGQNEGTPVAPPHGLLPAP